MIIAGKITFVIEGKRTIIKRYENKEERTEMIERILAANLSRNVEYRILPDKPLHGWLPQIIEDAEKGAYNGQKLVKMFFKTTSVTIFNAALRKKQKNEKSL